MNEVIEGIEARMPEFKPIFLNIWATDNHIWLHTDENENGLEMVVLTIDGDPVGRFYLSSRDDIQDVREEKVYTIHSDSETGDTIHIYDVAL